MSSQPPTALTTRLDNLEGGKHCPFCCGHKPGWVFVGWSGDGTEQYGPCPHCALGYLVEFPEKGRGPWGPDGYWRGKPIGGVEETCRCRESRIPLPQARETVVGIVADLDARIGDREENERAARAELDRLVEEQVLEGRVGDEAVTDAGRVEQQAADARRSEGQGATSPPDPGSVPGPSEEFGEEEIDWHSGTAAPASGASAVDGDEPSSSPDDDIPDFTPLP